MPAPALEVSGLEKAYRPGVPVLRELEFELRPGEVHALVGGNGAGKSTFARILTGLTSLDAGQVRLQGEPYAPSSKQDAARQGVILVLQELNIIPTLTVAENLFLHDLPHRRGVIRREELARRAVDALKRVGLQSVDPDSPAGTLGVGRQQLVEIAGALAQESSVLILDEPTSALTGPEIDLLFANIRRLRSDGVALIYISHRMDEIARIADRVTVLRDGRRIATHESGHVPTSQLVREMSGSEIAGRQAEARTARKEPAKAALTVRDLHAGEAVRGVSFEVHRGEILGIAGLIGSGRTETLRAIFGAEQADSGEIVLEGRESRVPFSSPASASGAGLALIPEDRQRDGLLLTKSITVNATLATVPRYARGGVIRPAEEETAARTVCDRLAVKRDSLDQPAGELSGGNQQKIVMARWLLHDAAVFLCDEPTRGIDVAAKESIYELLEELAGQGKAIVVVSSDLTELLGICHRLLVMSAGRITGEFFPDTWTGEAITRASFEGYLERKEVA